MGDVRVSGADSPRVISPEEMAGQFQSELLIVFPEWKQRLQTDPSCLNELEREVHAKFARGADLVVAGLVALVMKQAAFDEACERTRQNYQHRLSRGRMRPMQIRLLGGLLIWVTSLYCAPRRSPFGKPEERVPGLHIELAQFGFAKGCSPALESHVSRQAALCPSLQFAQEELAREGVQLDVKTVGRITYQCGSGLLALRKQELLAWRSGTLPAGSELKGQRVTVQIDGGRTRIRGDLRPAPPHEEERDADGLILENAPGRSKKRARRTCDAEWREPKLVTIFVHDEKGRMVKDTLATVDATFLGPDALAELVAMHLHRLGAAQAASVTFVADGAPWIWDRIPTIVQAAKLDRVTVHEVLDCCHAAHHIALALAAFGMKDRERMPAYREYRTQLRNGQWQRVVDDLTELLELSGDNGEMRTEIAYLKKHGEAGRLKYPAFRALGVPIGSGAVESSIRRVINLRLKGNGIFWREEHAEEMLQVRAQVITNRWDERVNGMRKHLSQDGRLDWRWEPQSMSCKA